MIYPNAEPIGNRNPLPPIDLHPHRAHDEAPAEITFGESIYEAARVISANIEAQRIWKLVVKSAEAGGPVMAPKAESVPVIDSVYVAPPEASVVVYDGIYNEWIDTAPSEYCAPEEDVG